MSSNVPEEKPLEEQPKKIARSADVALGLAMLAFVCALVTGYLCYRDLISKLRTSIYDLVPMAVMFLGLITIAIASWTKFAIRRSEGKLRGLATARISQILVLLAYLMTCVVLNLPGFLEAQVRAKVSHVRTDMGFLGAVIEDYRSDHGSYPASATGEESINRVRRADGRWDHVPSFRITHDTNVLKTLTTPVAYIAAYPTDPFSFHRAATFVYHVAGKEKENSWILISPGPDHVYDIDPMRYFDSPPTQPLLALNPLTYDPTNGMVSRGDIWRVGQ